jgi:hypothetical protein
LVLKSRFAVGERSFLRVANRKIVKSIIEKSAKRFYVTLRRNINVGNHLHLLVNAPTPDAQRNFLRTCLWTHLSALKPRALRARTAQNASHFAADTWDARPFSRLVPWGRAYQAILTYLSLNSLEAIGFTKSEGRDYLRTLASG